MTRLQNAKKQLSEALGALESAASQTISESYQAGVSASASRMGDRTGAGADLSALVDEVNIIETKLNQAIEIIAKVGSGPLQSGTVEPGSITDGDT